MLLPQEVGLLPAPTSSQTPISPAERTHARSSDRTKKAFYLRHASHEESCKRSADLSVTTEMSFKGNIMILCAFLTLSASRSQLHHRSDLEEDSGLHRPLVCILLPVPCTCVWNWTTPYSACCTPLEPFRDHADSVCSCCCICKGGQTLVLTELMQFELDARGLSCVEWRIVYISLAKAHPFQEHLQHHTNFASANVLILMLCAQELHRLGRLLLRLPLPSALELHRLLVRDHVSVKQDLHI